MKYSFRNFYDLILTQAKQRGGKTALFVGDEKISYREILKKADTFAGFLANSGVAKGDRVALFMRNSAEFIYSIFAISKLGAISVPINTFLKEGELSYILEDSGAKVLISSMVHEKVVKHEEAQRHLNLTIWEGEATEYNTRYIPFDKAMSFPDNVEDNYLFIVDRKKDLIISKGINIYPREIEEVIDSFEDVASSAVLGIADEKSGEIPIVYIELNEGVESIDEAKLKKYLRENLANYKVPRQLHIIDELPKNATGKVLKRELKKKLKDN